MPISELGRKLRDHLEIEPPNRSAARTMFIAAVAARRRRPAWRVLAPVALGLVLLTSLGAVARTALPGQTLYPIREVLHSVGLAPSIAHEVAHRLDTARAALNEGEEPADAQEAIAALASARELLGEVSGTERSDLASEMEELEQEALGLLALDDAAADATAPERRIPTPVDERTRTRDLKDKAKKVMEGLGLGRDGSNEVISGSITGQVSLGPLLLNQPPTETSDGTGDSSDDSNAERGSPLDGFLNLFD